MIAVVMTAIALLTTKPILLLLNTPQPILPNALTYMYIFMGGLLAVAAYYTPFSILRALGDSKTPLIFLVVCSLLNIVLDLVFVVGLKSGVAGAAIATVLSEALAAIACILYAFAKVPQFRQAFQHRAINKNLIAKTLQVGIPTGLQYALIYVSSIILQRIVNGFGESVIGAFTATTQIELLVQQIFAALGAAIVTYTGQNIGAGDSMYALMNGIVEVIARVAFAVGLTAIPFIGMWGIWLTTGLTWTVTALFALVRYKHGAWKSKKLVCAFIQTAVQQ